MVSMARGQILPAALEHQRSMAEAVAATKAAGLEPGEKVNVLRDFIQLVDQFRQRTAEVERRLAAQPTTIPPARGADVPAPEAGDGCPAGVRGRDRKSGGSRRVAAAHISGFAVPEVIVKGER